MLATSSLQAAKDQSYQLKTIVKGLNNPWAMVILPNRDLLVTERAGNIKVVRDNKILDTINNVVSNLYYAGQGGLLDIMLDQNFLTNNTVYISYVFGKRGANATRLISAKLESTENGYELTHQATIFTAKPLKKTALHHGGRIAQLKDGTVLLTVGDGYTYREQAQALDNHFGKIIRINTDGSVPQDNPFVKTDNALDEIFTYGHRNQQGIALVNGVIYEHEHGPKGGDEMNIIHPGTNYGWPIATFGVDYNGTIISSYTEYEGTQPPLIDWTPSIAPSSMTAHNKKLFVTSLAERSIRRLNIDGDTLVDEGIVFDKLNTRLRDIVSDNNQSLYVLTDGNDAKIIKIVE